MVAARRRAARDVKARGVDVAKIEKFCGLKTAEQFVDERLVIAKAFAVTAAAISDGGVTRRAAIPLRKGRPGIVVLDDEDRSAAGTVGPCFKKAEGSGIRGSPAR